MVAAAVAADLPDRVAGIILEDPPFHTMGRDIHATHWQSQFAAMRDIARRGGSVDHLTDSLADIPVPRPDGTSRRLGDLRDRASLQWSAQCLASIDPEILTPIIAGHWLDGYDAADMFARIQCPTLILQADPRAGGAMTDADVHLARDLIARCKVERFDGCGHLLHWLQPARIAALVAEFLEK
jgi:pimeloyl-ACP methyl ester carboxylesterase